MPITKEFKKNGKVFYKAKAIVKRSTLDSNGRVTLIAAGPALKSFFRIALPKSPLRKIQPLRAKFDHTIFIGGRGANKGKSRRPNGRKRFVEPIQFGFEPGDHVVTVSACMELSKHPVKTILDIKGWVDFILGFPELLTKKGFGKKIAEAIFQNRTTCGRTAYNFKVLAKVPKIEGKTLEAASKLLEARNLRLLELDPLSGKRCKGTKAGKIVRQGVRAGKRREAGSFVSYRLCEKKKKTEREVDFAGTWKTNQGRTVLVKPQKGFIAGSFGKNGTLSGSVKGRTASGLWRIGSQSGPFSITFNRRGTSFTGFCSGTWKGTKR